MPDLKTAVICAQDDALGRPSVATYLAAFEAHGIDVLDTVFFDLSTTDFAPVMTSMLAKNPGRPVSRHLLCRLRASPVRAGRTSRATRARSISCTADFYEQIVEKTSKEFMEGFIFPSSRTSTIRPSRRKGSTSTIRAGSTPSTASAGPVSGVRCPGSTRQSMDLWVQGAQRTGSVEPQDVLAGMKQGGEGKHAFGTAKWWGKELFGDRQRAGRQLAGGGDRERARPSSRSSAAFPSGGPCTATCWSSTSPRWGEMYHQRG